MSEVNSINAAYANPQYFRGAEGQQTSGSNTGSAFTAGIGIGGATTLGVKYLGSDKFEKRYADASALTDDLKNDKVEFKSDLESELKTKFEEAQKVAKAEVAATETAAPATTAPAATEAPKATETPAATVTQTKTQIEAEHKLNLALTEDANALANLEKQKELTGTIQKTYDDVIGHDLTDKRTPLEPKEEKALITEQASLKSSIENDEKLLKNKKLSAERKQAITDRIESNKTRLDEIDAKLLPPADIKAKALKQMAKESDAQLKQIGEELKGLTKVEKDALKLKTDAQIKLTKAINANKPAAEIAKIQGEFNSAELAHSIALNEKTMKVSEQALHTSIKNALAKPAAGVETALNNAYNNQKRVINLDGTKGSALDEINGIKAEAARTTKKGATIPEIKAKEGTLEKAQAAHKNFFEANANVATDATREAEFNTLRGQTAAAADAGKVAADAGKVAAKEGAEATKTAPKAVQEFFEAAKDTKLKTKWGKAGIIGGITAAVIFIGAKMMGGSKTEQA